MNQLKVLLGPLVLLFHSGLIAQQVTARVMDAKTLKGIPYATIQYGPQRGTITNEEGRFSIALDSTVTPQDSIHISSMGYEKTTLPWTQLQDTIITIAPKAIALNSVYLFDQERSVDEIIRLMKAKMPQNINTQRVRQRFFLRQSVFNHIQKADLGFERSSIAELDKDLIDSIALSIPEYSYHYTETLGDLFKANGDNKIDIIRAAELYDKTAFNSIDDFSDQIERIFKANVKPDSYLKIKSGIFSQKVQVDSLLQETDKETEEVLSEEWSKETPDDLLNAQKDIFNEILGEVFYADDSKVDLLRKTRKYEFSLVGHTDIESDGVYIIDFVPKGSAPFQGRLYVNMEDFAVMRIDFENLKNLRNFRLLGIYYRETKFKGTMRFASLPNGRYELSFLDLSFGRWFRMDRPLDVIEKNKNVKGRRKQNELRLNIDFQMANTHKWELVVYNSDLIAKNEFEDFEENPNIKARYMPQYDPEFWKGHTIMEPNQAIREFSVATETLTP
ncbi:MAG: carboxypeptidase-like regulatory domain-containing protein [Bacteroidota bacterium]